MCTVCIQPPLKTKKNTLASNYAAKQCLMPHSLGLNTEQPTRRTVQLENRHFKYRMTDECPNNDVFQQCLRARDLHLADDERAK